LAKLPSDWLKPDGLFVSQPGEVESFLLRLSVNRLPGVGKVTGARLEKLGIKTVREMRDVDIAMLEREFGRVGVRLHEKSRSCARKEPPPAALISAPKPTIFPATNDRRSLPSRAEWAGRRVSEICWEAFIHLRVQESSLKKSANAILKVHENSVIQLIDIHNLSI
jgi:DNA polymerase IV